MTLHWWMHWFWITRCSLAVAALLLLATAQSLPLPASTLFPHGSAHPHPHSRTPASPTFDDAEPKKQTDGYNGPVWSSSPDIEEPFYPTTASSDGLDGSTSTTASSLPTQHIPITPRSISHHELLSETYPPIVEDAEQSTRPTEFTLQQRNGQDPLAQTRSSVATDLQGENSEEDGWEEPRALPLASAQSKAPPKNEHEEGESRDHLNLRKISKVAFINSSVSNVSVGGSAQVTKHAQRLVTRDLSNVSEPVLSSVSSSHGSDSTNSGNSSVRPNNRGSKAIGHYSSAGENFSSDAKGEQISDPGATGEGTEAPPPPPHLEEAGDGSRNSSKTGSDDSNTVANKTEGTEKAKNESNVNSTTPPSVLGTGSVHPAVLEEEAQLNSRRSKLESDSSKVATAAAAATTTTTTVRVAAPPPTPAPRPPKTPPPGSTRADLERSASLSQEETTLEATAAPVSRSRVAASPSDAVSGGLDAAAITGIALGIALFAGLAGGVSVVLYRRRYLNKPQTLNDKCSNPDSSGYIDDSTLRENSEEMYSLDNDSFLNSLEAMTIQNYWTDNVKHTKL